MGYAYTELVVPAILYSNPGITKERFANLLDEVHPSMRQYSREDSWDYYDSEWGEKYFGGGLVELAGDLKLSWTKKFKEFQKDSRDDKGLRISSPLLIRQDYFSKKFEVIVHEKNILGREKTVKNEWAYEKVFEGDIFAGGIVKKILREEFLGEDDEEDWDRAPNYFYDLRIIPIKQITRLDNFNSEKEFYDKYPLFHPDNKFVWSKNRGEIYTGMRSEKKYFWRKEKNKYYLDEKTFDILCNDFVTGSSFGYTDLIMTSEAIKNKAWKLLSYKGTMFIDDFLKDFPQSNGAYKNAVYDAHLSIFAKKNKMTNSDLIRFRALNKFKG